MAIPTTNRVELLKWLLLLLLGFSGSALATCGSMDCVLTGGGIANPSSPGGASAAASAAMARSLGKLVEMLTTIFGIYYSMKAVMIYAQLVSGRAAGQQHNFGSVLSHFVAGVFAYHSRAVFTTVHNTVPMIPDFGRLMYDAELMLGLMS
jgi:hypothetical protein